MIKGSVIQEDIAILNVYVHSNSASKRMRQKLIDLQGEIDICAIILEDFNALFQ